MVALALFLNYLSAYMLLLKQKIMSFIGEFLLDLFEAYVPLFPC